MKIFMFCSAFVLTSCVIESFTGKNRVDDREGYTLVAGDCNQKLAAGHSLSFELNILRSRCYHNKPVALTIHSTLPAELQFSIQPHAAITDRVTVDVSAAANVKKGTYNVVIAGDAMRPGMHLKATVVNLTVL